MNRRTANYLLWLWGVAVTIAMGAMMYQASQPTYGVLAVQHSPLVLANGQIQPIANTDSLAVPGGISADGTQANAGQIRTTTLMVNGVPISGSGGGITNSAGNNVLMKSNATNAIACAETDDGTTFSVNNKFSVTESNGNVTTNNTYTGINTYYDVVFGNPQSPAALGAGNNNDYNPANWTASSRWSLTGNASGSTLTGFTATIDGDTKNLSNLGSTVITITNQDANSNAANRIITPANGQPYIVGIGSTVQIIYNGANSRWYIKAASDSFSPTFGDLSLQSQAPVSLGAGLTSNWTPFTPNQSFVLVAPNASTTPGQLATTDTAIDGLNSDGQNSAPIGGALRVICQSAISHGPLVIEVAESSASSTGNQIYINADGNTTGTGFALAHRQCALFVYNQDRSKWQPVATSDGVLRRLSIAGYWNDTSLGATITGYDAGGTASTHLCGLTRLRWASAGATTVNNWVACNPGDIKIVQVFSGGITLKNNNSTGGAAFFLPGGVDKVLVSGCIYSFIYDGPNPGWYIMTTSATSGLAC